DALVGDQHLLLELDALVAADLAHITLDADGHARLQLAVVAARGEVLQVGTVRVFVAEPDAMENHGVAVRCAAVGQAEALLGHLAEAHARLDQVDVVVDLLVGEAVEPLLLVARPSRPAEEGAREIGAIAEGANEVGVEAYQLAGADDAVAAFLEPG